MRVCASSYYTGQSHYVKAPHSNRLSVLMEIINYGRASNAMTKLQAYEISIILLETPS